MHFRITGREFSLKAKLTGLCTLLAFVPVLVVGGFALSYLSAFGKSTVEKSSTALENQAVELLKAGVERDRGMVEDLIGQASMDVRRLAASPNIMNHLKAVAGENEILNSLAQKEVKGIVESLLTACKVQQAVMQKKAASDYHVAVSALQSRGGIAPQSLSVQWEVTDQVAKESKSLVLPLMQVGFDPIRPAASPDEPLPIVDDVEKLTGAACTIFQKIDPEGNMLEIATNVRNPDGARAGGGIMAAVDSEGKPNAAISAVLEGKSYTGRAFLINDWYTTIYGPIYERRATSGEVIGMLYAGVREQGTGDLIKAITDTRIGESGFISVIDSGGIVRVHPRKDMTGRSVLEDGNAAEYKQIIADRKPTDTGMISFSGEGRKKFAVYGYYPDWDWIITATGFWDEFSAEASKASSALLDEEVMSVYKNAVVESAGKKAPMYSAMAYVDENGREVLSMRDGAISRGSSFKGDEPWFGAASRLGPGQVYNSGVVQDPVDGKPVVMLASPVMLGDRFKGVVALHFVWDHVTGMLAKRVYGKTGYTYIMREDGILVSHPRYGLKDGFDCTSGRNGEQLAQLVRDHMLKGETGAGSYIFEGSEKLAVYMPIGMGDKTYSIAASGPKDEFLLLAHEIKSECQANSRKVFNVLGLITVALAVVGSLIGVLLSGQISRRLMRTIDGLTQGTVRLSDAAADIYSSSERVAYGASAQAAGIEQISASLEEIAAMSHRNARDTSLALASGRESARVLAEADKTMGRSIQAMRDIRSSSEQCGKIIRDVEGIAVATNILALNAAVEAAHAGEAGRGFAVVADQVKKLATQVAEASRIAEQLIRKVAGDVDAGADLLHRTKDSFDRVVGENHKTGGLIEAIAAASEEQAGGVAQVAQALAQMDEIVQQNAASAEESAAAVEETKAQAQQLKDAVLDLNLVVHGGRGVDGDGDARREETVETAAASGYGVPVSYDGSREFVFDPGLDDRMMDDACIRVIENEGGNGNGKPRALPGSSEEDLDAA